MSDTNTVEAQESPKKPLSYKTVSNNRKRTRGRINYIQVINYEVLGVSHTKTIHHRYIK